VRAVEESAEAVVVKRAVETRKERRAEEPREGHRPTIRQAVGKETDETTRVLQLRQPPESVGRESKVESFKGPLPAPVESKPPRKEESDEAQ
jgi:hypothetical protein